MSTNNRAVKFVALVSLVVAAIITIPLVVLGGLIMGYDIPSVLLHLTNSIISLFFDIMVWVVIVWLAVSFVLGFVLGGDGGDDITW